MPRAMRVEYPGAVYHVRGVRPQIARAQPCEARFWDWKLGPAKAYYLQGLAAFGEPHIQRFLERFWRYVPQIATVGLGDRFRDDGAIGTQEESAGFRRKLRAWRVLHYSRKSVVYSHQHAEVAEVARGCFWGLDVGG